MHPYKRCLYTPDALYSLMIFVFNFIRAKQTPAFSCCSAVAAQKIIYLVGMSAY